MDVDLRGLGADLEFPTFRRRPPWWGTDLQTLRNFLVPIPVGISDGSTTRLKLALADGSGDTLCGALHRPRSERADGVGRPLVVLIHGLSGSEDSTYMRASAAYQLARGHPVLRLNLRGAGPSRSLCRFQYHAGRSTDLRDALAALPADTLRHGLFLVGYSLGGNLLLKFLAEYAADFPVLGASSVSAPIDLAACSRRFREPRNRVYQWKILRSMKRESLAPGGYVTAEESRRIRAARSVWEFDDDFVAPRNGYADAEAYYADNMAQRFLESIRVPTLVIQALDDPWIPGEAYTRYPWERNPRLIPLLPWGGGHVGFHGRGERLPWHDRCLALFLDSVGV